LALLVHVCDGVTDGAPWLTRRQRLSLCAQPARRLADDQQRVQDGEGYLLVCLECLKI
jgi:hypothetical protein